MNRFRIGRRALVASVLAAPAIVALPASATRAQSGDEAWKILAGNDSGPSGRWDHSLIIDTWNGRLLVVGGRTDSGPVRDDLWSFDLAQYQWTELDQKGPKRRSGAATAIAPDGSGFYYFGGETKDAVRDDFWWFDFATSEWQRIEPATGPTPAPRTDARGAIDALGRFVVTHGCDGDKLYDDTWAYDPATQTWTEISPIDGVRPMARCDHELISLPSSGLLLLSGGCSDGIGPCPQGDLWAFDVYNNIWSDITPISGPSPRTASAMTSLGGEVLQVGGLTDLGPQSDVWNGYLQEGGFGWTELTYYNHGPVGIYRRSGHDMVASGREHYVFGGKGVEGALSDLWTFSLDRIAPEDDSGESIEPG